MKFISILLFTVFISCVFQANAEDQFLWLEQINSDKSMQWVEKTNAMTAEKLTHTPLYQQLYAQALTILNGESRLPSLTQRGKWLYNFWQDDKNPRGIYRRTSLTQIHKEQPKWQTVLDMDNFSQQNNNNYDFHGMNCLPPKYVNCLVSLSPGGGDAVEIREFNLDTLAFVSDGFNLALAKSQVSWVDKNTLYVGTDFGADSMTESGYPRLLKKWTRGTPLAQAETIYAADKTSMSTNVFKIEDQPEPIYIVSEATDFWTSKKFQIHNNTLVPLILPSSADISGVYQQKLVVSLQQDWQFKQQTYQQGEILIIDTELLRGGQGNIERLFKPDAKTVVEDINVSKVGILITLLENVTAKLHLYQAGKNGKWNILPIEFPKNGSISVKSVDDKTGDFFVEYQSFITPPALYHVKAKKLKPVLIKQQAASFDGSQFKVEQFFASSNDTTQVPYFVVMHKNTVFNGKNPTHIFSYGGFRNALTPSYSGSYEALSGAYGKLWLERGGVFVLANIRGGGEYGPAWHAAALLKNRHKAFEDFEAVARDLFDRKITSAKHLGIEGRSNGGLLVTATMTRHPELYAAVICGAPLIDMHRYNKLLAGASWMAEFGNPDDADMWDYIKTYSPYQNLKQDVQYPPIFFYTSTHDDRVHPAHARKMAAKMLTYGYQVDYYENTEGGHHGFSTNEQLAHRLALSYTHLWNHLR